MKLSNILKNIKYELIQGSLDIDIKDIIQKTLKKTMLSLP